MELNNQLDNKYKSPDNYTWRDVDNELVVLNLHSGAYYTFNNVGRSVWIGVSEGKNVSEISQEIKTHFNVNFDKAVSDVKSFIDNLLSEGLLIPEKEVNL